MKWFLLLIICILKVDAQTNPCEGKVGKGFFPLYYGFEKQQSINGERAYFIEGVKDSLHSKGITYYRFLNQSEQQSRDLLLRKDQDTIWRYNKRDGLEYAYFIDKAEVGVKWNGVEIVSVNEQISTPYCDHKNLILTKEFSRTGQKVEKYYQEGLGLVAKKADDVLIQYYIPNSEDLTITKAFYENCEDSKCTISKVFEFIQKSDFKKKAEALKLKNKKNSFIFEISISDKGKVEGLSCLRSFKKEKSVVKIMHDVLMKMPLFVPASYHPYRNKEFKLKFQYNMNLK